MLFRNTLLAITIFCSVSLLWSMEDDNKPAVSALQSYGIDLDSTLQAMGLNSRNILVVHKDKFAVPGGVKENCQDGECLVGAWAAPFLGGIKLQFPVYRGQRGIHQPKMAPILLFAVGHEAAHLTPYNRFLIGLGLWVKKRCSKKIGKMIMRAVEKHADLTAARQLPCVDGGISFCQLCLAKGEPGDDYHPKHEDRLAYLEQFKRNQECRKERTYKYDAMRFWFD